ncbi:MAG: T9SS type A sorting domain-containing protein [Bacteroidia bacterium]|nr:T9SS type A sorting domain-containing protein [Bacteroidia bacterium]
MQLIDIRGTLQQEWISAEATQLNLEKYQPGIYILRIISQGIRKLSSANPGISCFTPKMRICF